MENIHIVGLACIRNRKLLVARKKHTTKFILPGGKRVTGENEINCLVREVFEELCSQVHVSTLSFLGEYTDRAANEPETLVTMKLYTGTLLGALQPSHEIEEIQWADLPFTGQLPIAELVKNQVLPRVMKLLEESGETIPPQE